MARKQKFVGRQKVREFESARTMASIILECCRMCAAGMTGVTFDKHSLSSLTFPVTLLVSLPSVFTSPPSSPSFLPFPSSSYTSLSSSSSLSPYFSSFSPPPSLLPLPPLHLRFLSIWQSVFLTSRYIVILLISGTEKEGQILTQVTHIK